MVLYGYLHRVGNSITTDDIIDPIYRTDDPAMLAAYCLASINAAIAERTQHGDVLVAGRDFGTGSETEHAVLALQAVGFAAVICVSASPAFIETATRYGLPVLVAAYAVPYLTPGGLVRLDLASGTISDRDTSAQFTVPPVSPDLLNAVRRAHILSRTRKMAEDEGFV